MKAAASGVGYPIVLTAGSALMANYRFGIGSGYASMFPAEFMPFWKMLGIFQLSSDKTGRMKMAQLGLSKVEAALLASGFTRDDVIIANPKRLNRVIGPATRIVGIGALDPVGLAYGAKVTEFTLRQFHIPCRHSIMSAEFLRVVRNPDIQKRRQSGQLKVIVGGPGIWQIADTGMQEHLGIDCILDGEAEGVVGDLFRKALAGEPLPQRVQGRPVSAKDMPRMMTASRCGVVEISRGCGRGCRFCVPGLLKFRSFPLEKILSDIEVNWQAGIREVSLQSDDFMRYGSTSLKPARKPVLQLLQAVKDVAGTRFGPSFVSAATILQDERLLEEAAEVMELGGRRYSTIEMGIETGSPDLLAKHMPGKVKPFKMEEWSDVVVGAANALHDNHWIGCYSLIIGLPGETSKDVVRTMELVDRIKHFNCVITPVIFVPAGRLRRTTFHTFDRMTPEQWALFHQCIEQTLENAILWLGRVSNRLVNLFMKVVIHRLFMFSAGLFRKRRYKLLRKMGWRFPK
ncbi:MAG: B12-binding domain-containing radical SAM protein [Promethearchaeota archaeon]